jgi:hypothetical protein
MTVLAIAAGLAVVAGAALQSAIGFGFALVAAPLLFAATTPEQAVGLLVVLGLEVNLLTLVGERRRPRPRWAEVAPVVAWSLPGALAGIAILRALDDLALQGLVSAGVLLALGVNLRLGRRRPDRVAVDRPAWWARPAAGFAAGALNTSTTTGGPPVVLLLLRRGLAPATVRDTLTATFLGFAAMSSTALLLTGTEGALPQAAWLAALVPAAALGHLAGRPVFARLAAGRAYEPVLTAVLLVTLLAGLVGVVASR